MGGVIRRAKNKRLHIFEEIELIKNEFPMTDASAKSVKVAYFQ